MSTLLDVIDHQILLIEELVLIISKIKDKNDRFLAFSLLSSIHKSTVKLIKILQPEKWACFERTYPDIAQYLIDQEYLH